MAHTLKEITEKYPLLGKVIIEESIKTRGELPSGYLNNNVDELIIWDRSSYDEMFWDDIYSNLYKKAKNRYPELFEIAEKIEGGTIKKNGLYATA